MSFSKLQMGVAAATLATSLGAGAAFADATATVCTGPNGTNCATETITLSTGGSVNHCVDGKRVTEQISSSGGRNAVNDALTGMYNVALRAAEAVEARGVAVTGFQAQLEGCSGSWAPYCTTVTVGEVNVDGVEQRGANGIIEALTGIEAQSCGFLSNARHPIMPVPGR